MARPLSDDEKQQIRELHARGMGRNEIAKAVERPYGTVTNFCRTEGLSFAQSAKVAEATEVRAARLRAVRAKLAEDLLDDAKRLREQLWKPAKAFNFGGKDNTLNETTLDEPTFADKRNLIQAASVAVTAATKLEDYDRGGADEEQRSALAQLLGTLKRAWNESEGGDPQ